MGIEIYDKIKKEFRKFYDKSIEKLEVNIYEILNLNQDININFIDKSGLYYYKIVIEKDSNINIKLDINENNFLVLFFEVYLNNNVKFNYNIKGKINGVFYHYINVIHKSNSKSNLDERFSVYKKLYNISKINIEKDSENSEGYLNEIILSNNNSFIMSIPILNIENEKSKGFHGIKNIKLDKDQIFYLNTKGIKEEDINKIIEDSILV